MSDIWKEEAEERVTILSDEIKRLKSEIELREKEMIRICKKYNLSVILSDKIPKYSEFEKGYVEEAVKMILNRMKKLGVEKFRIKELISLCKAYDINIEDL